MIFYTKEDLLRENVSIDGIDTPDFVIHIEYPDGAEYVYIFGEVLAILNAVRT